jgi:hypothetical protein
MQCHASAMAASCCDPAAGLLPLLVVVLEAPPLENTVSLRVDATTASCLHTSSAQQDISIHQHACRLSVRHEKVSNRTATT